MNLPHSWRDAWECARDTAVLAVFIAAMIWLLLFVLPASVGADGPRWDGDWACRPQCGMRPSTGPWGGFGGYLPSTQPLGLFPGAVPLWIPQSPAPVTVVQPQQPGYTVFVVVPPSTPWTVVTPVVSPASTPTATPVPPPPPPVPQPVLPPAPTPAVQAPMSQGPAIQPLTCTPGIGCGLGDAPADNEVNSDVAPSAASMETRADVTMDVPTLAAQSAAKYGAPLDCMLALLRREGGDLLYPKVSPTNDHGPAQFHVGPNGRGIFDDSPQARAGGSVDDPVSNIDAMAYFLATGADGGLRNWQNQYVTTPVACTYSQLPQLARMVR